MEHKAGIIFDMDGVIFDTERLWKIAFEIANQKFGLDLTEEYRISTCGKNEKVIREELIQMYPDLDVAGYRTMMLNEVQTRIENGSFSIKPGFESLIGFLKENGFSIALATSSHKTRAEKLFELKDLRIDELFDATVFGDDVGTRSKPDPYIFQLAAQRISCSPESCYVIEDSINGIEAADKGGFKPIMCVDMIPPDDYCKSHTVAIVNELSEIKRVLGKGI